jgi:hypothetical protein
LPADAVEHVQAVGGAHPLRGDVVVDDVAFVEHERDVSGRVLGDDPGRLRVEVRRQGRVGRVDLRVREDDDGVRESRAPVGAPVAGGIGVAF